MNQSELKPQFWNRFPEMVFDPFKTPASLDDAKKHY